LRSPAQPIVVVADRQITQRHPADGALAAVEDREPAYLLLLHQLCRRLHALILVTETDVAAHRLAHGHLLRVAAFGDGAHRDVAVRNHRDQAVVFTDREGADVQ
jgi:hypothetical protein